MLRIPFGQALPLGAARNLMMSKETEKLKPVIIKIKLAMSLAALEASLVACALAGPSPAPIVTEVVAPEVMTTLDSITPTPTVEITPTPAALTQEDINAWQ